MTLHLGLPSPRWHPAHRTPPPAAQVFKVTLCTKLGFKTLEVSAKSGLKRRTSQAQNRGRQISWGENSHPSSGQARGVLWLGTHREQRG